MFDTLRERLGRKPMEIALGGEIDRIMVGNGLRTIVFFPTNGVGFGHFTRLFAIARRIRVLDPDIEVIFFTTMPTLHLLESQGIPSYHVPGKKMFPDISTPEWNMVCEEYLSMVFTIHNPSLFVYDGTYPYRGMLNTIKGRDEIGKVWVRRGTFRKGATRIPMDSIDHFDVIISPRDSLEEAKDDTQEIKAQVFDCDPIIYASEGELNTRQHLRDRLGIPMDALVCYVQLGAGKINDIDSDILITLSELAKFENVYTVVGESMLGEPLEFSGPRVRMLRDYPNSVHFRSFDFAIIAGGYNSYHEVIRFGLPSISYPNLMTGMDDQLARVQVAEDAGAMIVLEDVNQATVAESISKMLDQSIREDMREAAVGLTRENGADQVAQYLIELLDG
jgi:UDP:flavonoid glycosyltransferase YjiC (YdhE family)